MTQTPQNPFDPIHPLDETFVGRGRLIEELAAGLAAGRSYGLNGPAGIGKSALLARICRRLNGPSPGGSGAHPLPFQVAYHRGITGIGELFERITAALVAALECRQGQPWPAEARDALLCQARDGRLDLALQGAAARGFAAVGRIQRPVLLLDALHRLHDGTILRGLFGALNREADRGHLSVLLVSRQPLVAMVQGAVPDTVSDLRYLLNGCRELGPLDPADGEALTALAARHGWSAEPAAAAELHRLTAGNPYRMQAYLQEALAQHGALTVDTIRMIHTPDKVRSLDGLLAKGLPRTSGPAMPGIFVSYSHRDEAMKDRLMTHLAVLGQARARAWCDDLIQAGGNWYREIVDAVDTAEVAVLLVTADFLKSKFILDVEVPRILDRQARGELHVVPVIAQHCAWSEVPWLARLNLRPKNGAPVWRDNGTHAEEDMSVIVREIARLLEPI